MPFRRISVLIFGACWLVCPAARATQSALIVVGITGDTSTMAELTETARAIREGLLQRGFAPENIELQVPSPPDGKVTRDSVLQSLKKRQNLSAGDEFCLILLGFSGRSEDNQPAFQVSGPRLTATDLKTALDAIAGRQFILVGTSDSGAFIPILLSRNRTVLTATREEGEIDLPRFPEAWAQTLNENPSAEWKQIAARAAILTDKAYAEENLAVGEHARLGDSQTGRVLEAPFGADAIAPMAAKTESEGSTPSLDASDIKVEIRKPNAEWEKQAATAETKKLIRIARSAPNPEGFSSLLLEQRLAYRVGDDRTAEDFVMQRIYLAKEDGVARWANFLLPQDPPAVTTRLEAARIIQPDGTSTVFNPAKMPAGTDDSNGMEGALAMVFLPDAHAGCVIEIAYRTRHILDASQPDFSEELAVQRNIPALKTELQLQIPPKMNLHFKLRNSDLKPDETVVNGMRTLTWNLANLPAFEPLPFDPPARDLTVALDISSLDSWDALAAWYHRLARGSDAPDDTVRAKAQEIAAGATNRLDKIRKVYEFVAALRYVAIEFGVNGIRPRTPATVLQNRYGDCKDKANLLIALLTDLGIDARFCLLNRGSSTDVTFPSWQFNHAIAYVPKAPRAGQADDLWLDTTDSTAPFLTLSPGDIGRPALVFISDGAQFLTVAVAGKEITNLEEQWRFEQNSDGTWSGSLQSTWSGLAEYGMRSSVRGLSPLQRDFFLQSALNRQIEAADFDGLSLTSSDDFSVPFQLQARVTTASVPRPRPVCGEISGFVSPARNRPMLLNDGQKLHLTQTLELKYDHSAPAEMPPSIEETAGGLHVTASWQRIDDRTIRRRAELEVNQPLVTQSNYPAVRTMLRKWLEYLAH